VTPKAIAARTLPRFIAVEGPIGVGKTSLCKRLAETFNYNTLLEKSEENPFLDRFYKAPQQYALSTQLFFLFQRAQQIQELRQDDMFEPVRVADFLIEKDQLFAQQNLDKDEYDLYQKVYQPYCRSCHMSFNYTDFAESAMFLGYSGLIQSYVCSTPTMMPQAQVTQGHLFSDGDALQELIDAMHAHNPTGWTATSCPQ